jgi:hypothetical protein
MPALGAMPQSNGLALQLAAQSALFVFATGMVLMLLDSFPRAFYRNLEEPESSLVFWKLQTKTRYAALGWPSAA